MVEILAILGPTATGKSALAMHLAERMSGEIVNADALQVYRGLEVGTAKPSRDDRRRVPHHLIDILDPIDGFSAGEFARRARAAISEIQRRGMTPIIVGGSGLYLRALLQGLSPIPPVPSHIRQGLRERLEKEGLAALRRLLHEIDPIIEGNLAPGDSQRVLRALEVWFATSRTLSSWRQEESPEHPLSALKIGLTLPRAVLYDRIARRAAAMLDQGWVEEVNTLLESGLSGSEPAFQAIGYRQLVDHLANRSPLSEALESIIVATRQYAKRQETWFRREADVRWYEAQDPRSLAREVEIGLPRVFSLENQE